MNADQTKAFSLIKNGHNIYVGGQAGCGKSFLIRETVKWAQHLGKKTGLACTTGVACCLYERTLKPMTIHKWSGIGDGRFNGSQLVALLHDDDRYSEAKKRIKDTDLLIIDEISMLSLRMFELLEHIMRTVRGVSTVFGGLQLIVVGDFLQLPPVRNARYNDSGEFCFDSIYFPKHCVYLSEVIRQNNRAFSTVIHNISLGLEIDEHTENYIETLSRPLNSSHMETVRLFACNTLVDMCNRENVMKLEGEMYVYDSFDVGEEKHLNSLIVPKALWVKKGAKVMLLRNLNSELVNGLRGKVINAREGEVDVHFPTLNKLSTLQRMEFSVFNPSSKTILAVRSQIPLKLCYAITFHKAQGMTLDRVEVDCRRIFQPGQLAMAMGRVRSVDGLRVINFKKNAILPQPKNVMEFLQRNSLPVKEDKSCCQHRVVTAPADEIALEENEGDQTEKHRGNPEPDEIIEVDGFDDEVIDEIIRNVNFDELLIEKPPKICEQLSDINMQNELLSFKFKDSLHAIQIQHNEYIDYLIKNMTKVNEFIIGQYSKLSSIYDETVTPTSNNTVPQSNLTSFFHSYQKYVTSQTYKSACINLFTNLQNVDIIFSLCFKIMCCLRQFLLRKKSEILPVTAFCKGLSLRSTEKQLTDTARGKIRYIAGYVVAKLHHKNSVLVRTSAYKTSNKDIENYERGKRSLQILDVMKTSELSLTESDYLSSLEETKRKQNINRGLTNVTDSTFLFFEMLVSKILKHLSAENLSIHGSDIYMYTKNCIYNDRHVLGDFLLLFSRKDVFQNVSSDNDEEHDADETVQLCMDDIVDNVIIIQEIFGELLDKTISLLMKQFSKDVLISLNITKKMEHRKLVMVSTKGCKEKKIPGKLVLTESANSPVQSTSHGSTNKSRKVLRKPVTTDCLDPHVSPIFQKGCKDKRKVLRKIVSAECPESPATLKSHESGTQIDDIACTECNVLAGDNEQWICCDTCNSWYHRKCAGLGNARKWKKYQKADAHFDCHLCD